jgi:hypothetical protein
MNRTSYVAAYGKSGLRLACLVGLTYLLVAELEDGNRSLSRVDAPCSRQPCGSSARHRRGGVPGADGSYQLEAPQVPSEEYGIVSGGEDRRRFAVQRSAHQCLFGEFTNRAILVNLVAVAA